MLLRLRRFFARATFLMLAEQRQHPENRRAQHQSAEQNVKTGHFRSPDAR